MSLIRYVAIVGIATTLTACGGALANPVPTVDPRAAQMNDALKPTDVPGHLPTEIITIRAVPTETAPAPQNADAPDPASLADGTFEVEIVIEQGTVILTPVAPVDEQTNYIVGDYTPASEFMNTFSIDFRLYERRNNAWTYSQVQIRLPEGSGPGTYEIEANALLMEDGKVAAYVDNFTDDDITEYVFYEDFSGSITITAIDDKLASGSFDFTGRSAEGHVANVTGAFNGIGNGHTWINTGSY